MIAAHSYCYYHNQFLFNLVLWESYKSLLLLLCCFARSKCCLVPGCMYSIVLHRGHQGSREICGKVVGNQLATWCMHLSACLSFLPCILLARTSWLTRFFSLYLGVLPSRISHSRFLLGNRRQCSCLWLASCQYYYTEMYIEQEKVASWWEINPLPFSFLLNEWKWRKHFDLIPKQYNGAKTQQKRRSKTFKCWQRETNSQQ